MKTALVFSAGGMFGAWQAGAWRVCAEHFQPDLIVGASIGSLNGWIVAGGASPSDLVDHWLESGSIGPLRPRLPRGPFSGWVDTRHMEGVIRRLHSTFQPRLDYALVATDIRRLRPRIFRAHEVTAEHLIASCALPFIFDQPRLDGRRYSDGGLLNALPAWAAAELGAHRIIALNVLPVQPNPIVRMAGRAIRKAARWTAPRRPRPDMIHLKPSRSLGGFHQMMNGDPRRLREWIALGEADAHEQLKVLKSF